MMIDDEDDTHFCLKCHLTIIGLDNYVNHRKAGCSKHAVEQPKSPLPSQLLPPDDSFNLKADDFFSSLELQSSSKKQPPASTSGKNFSGILTRSKTTAVIQGGSKDHEATQKSVWIGGPQLRLGSGDNQHKLDKAVDQLEEERKEEVGEKLDVFADSEPESEEFEFEEDESSDEDNDAPPRNHTGGKWKPSSPIQWGRAQEWAVPGPSYTGGKWKPPPTHTRGKWRPEEDVKEEAPKVKARAPPPTYSKGKWLPVAEPSRKAKISDDSPFRKSSGMVQYWCRPCNRSLASKIVYERHIKSDLHYRRTLTDKELDDSIGEKRTRGRKFEVETLKRGKHVTVATHQLVKKRKRRTIFVKCDVCNAKVRKSSIGKHLISHYHCRKGDIYTAKAQIMVLDNIRAIILQSPFQCAACKFYFNHQSDFLAHWRSKAHNDRAARMPGYFSCVFCKFNANSNEEMHQHLVSNEHSEVVSVINRSVPIIIKKIDPRTCPDCGTVFMLTIALKKHCESTGHQFVVDQAFKDYICTSCKQVFRSNISLRIHRKNVHGHDVFICTCCKKNFKTREEARTHRNTAEHRHQMARLQPKKKKCDFCKEVFLELEQFKLHMKDLHPEHNPKCLNCGETFALPQDLSVHLRTKSCTYPSTSTKSPNDKTCDKCHFSSTSTSELLFHKVLHDPPLLVPQKDANKAPIPKYNCPLCDLIFAKSSLQAHLRVHTDERPFVCEICHKAFARKNNWLLHAKGHNRSDFKVKKSSAEKSFLCATCGASFRRRSVLKQHMTIHLGRDFKCQHPDCPYYGRTPSELKAHMIIHNDEHNYSCNDCHYRGKTLRQLRVHMRIHTGEKKYSCPHCKYAAGSVTNLRRHLRLHTGAKPYVCPHCPYRCTSLDNLRKHILTKSSHKGKCIYECTISPSCLFQTNFAKDFKVHLLNKHSDSFTNNKEATSYITGIYDNLDDEMASTNQPNESTAITDEMVQDHQDDMLSIVDGSESHVDNLNETWNVVESYDVEESGAMVPFNSVLFQGHF